MAVFVFLRTMGLFLESIKGSVRQTILGRFDVVHIDGEIARTPDDGVHDL